MCMYTYTYTNMIENIINYISVVDITLVIIAITAIMLRKIQPSKISVLPSDRLFTVIQNKWISSSNNKYMFSPSWFVRIEAVMASEKYTPLVNPGRFRPVMHTGDSTSDKIATLQKHINALDDNNVTHIILKEEIQEEINMLLGKSVESLGQIFENGEVGSTGGTGDDLVSTMLKQRSGMLGVATQREDLKNPTGNGVRKYVIRFLFPFWVDAQLHSLINLLCKINLSEEQKDELLEKLYWKTQMS